MPERLPLSRTAIAIADHLIPLTPEQRDDVIVLALCIVGDDSDPGEPIPYKLAGGEVVGTTLSGVKVVRTRRHPVSACDDVPEPMLDGAPIPMESIPVEATGDPSEPLRPRRVSAKGKPVSSATEAVARSIVEVLSGHPGGLSKGALASALNFSPGDSRYQTALRFVISADRIRATGSTNQRRYYPAGK